MTDPIFKITKTTKEQSKLNSLYMNPSFEYNSDTEYILIDDKYLFAIQQDASVPKGMVAMSRIQREFMNKVNENEKILINCYDRHFTDDINCIKFNIEVLNSDKAELDASELKQSIKDIYENYPFNLNQKLVLTLSDKPDFIFILTVLEMICENPQPFAILTADTDVMVTTTSAKISLINNQAESLLLDANFSFEDLGIGGLKKEFEQMFRRAFVQRLFEPSVIKKMGIPHVKGIMLYGPPGTGKTLIARKLGSLLNARPPKIVNGPEILNKYVGQSEENIRNLFKEAEEEWKLKKEDSQLHIIIFDEIDAICKKRGSSGSAGVGDQVVNQMLSKIDGVESLDNILVIGMTNRLDLIDDALLRPGRFEIHLEISLPDESSRLEIFKIHTKKMEGNDYLSRDIDFNTLAKASKNYTGAEISAVIRSSSSFALERKVKSEEGNKLVTDENVQITMGDMLRALEEVKPAFGFNEKEFETFNKVFYETDNFMNALDLGKNAINHLKNTNLFNTNSILFYGETGTGKTTLAVRLALLSTFPFIKIISPRHMVGMGEFDKVNYIKDKFMDAYKSSEAVIILDDIEGLIEYVNIGPRFSNSILQALKIFIKAEDRNKLYVIGTSSTPEILQECGVLECFSETFEINKISKDDHVKLCNQNPEFKDILLETPLPLKKVMAMLSRPDMSIK